MAKTLRTSGDYTIKTGAGASGSNVIDLDSKTVRVRGDLIIDGDQTVVNTSNLSVEDTFIELARNNSGTTLDAGIYINRGIAGNNAAFYWDASEVSFKAATVTDDAATSPITSATLANIKVAEPSNNSDAATKFYVDNQVGGAGFSIFFSGDDSTSITASPASTVYISGGNNIVTSATEEPD